MNKWLLLLLPTLVGAGSTVLTLDTYDSLRGGKNAFIKFYAPWCGHCKAMKQAWEDLGDEFAGSSSVLIGNVDCTADGESLCQKFNVQGYPTVKYFKDGDTEGEDYKGGRDLESLVQHVKDHLEILCTPSTGENCSDKEKDYIDKMKAKTAEERETQKKRLAGMQSGSMKAELKQWLNQRLNILNQLSSSSDEL